MPVMQAVEFMTAAQNFVCASFWPAAGEPVQMIETSRRIPLSTRSLPKGGITC